MQICAWAKASAFEFRQEVFEFVIDPFEAEMKLHGMGLKRTFENLSGSHDINRVALVGELQVHCLADRKEFDQVSACEHKVVLKIIEFGNQFAVRDLSRTRSHEQTKGERGQEDVNVAFKMKPRLFARCTKTT